MKHMMRDVLKALKSKSKMLSFKISLIYFVVSFFWILFSDRIVHSLFKDSGTELMLNTFKGWFYIIIISVVLYILLSRAFKSLEEANKELYLSEQKVNQKYEELKVSEDRLNRAQSIAHVGNWEIDIINQTFWASEEAFKLYGLPNDSPYISLISVQKMVVQEDRPMMDLALKELISDNKDYDVEFRIIRGDDNQLRIMHSIAKLERDINIPKVKVLGVVRDITEEKQADQRIKQSNEELKYLYEDLAATDEELKHQLYQIHKLAYDDSITGLPNRLWFQKKVTEIIQSGSDKAALYFIDLDNFKNVNDSFGHSFGDTVLIDIGDRLANTVGDNAIVARLGGDEFAIIMNESEQLEQIDAFARGLLKKLETSFKEKDIDIHLTTSIGVAIYPDHALSFEELLKNADTAMYKAKKQGKNQYVIFDQSMNQEFYKKIAMESNLRSALDCNEIFLYYQPVYNLKTNKICSFEALARWKSAMYGMVSPVEFIPLAEETGLILQIGEHVLRTACGFIKRINASSTEKIMISVNISIYQLMQNNFVTDLLQVLDDNELDAEYLELEVTESILIENTELILKKMEELKKHGIKVALDDFGTGYSSLTYLKKLPISILKLDKAFIDDITINSTDNNIVRSIIMLANILDLAVVAEGVEDKEQFDCLAGYGCDMIQGFYISKPLPEHDVEKILQREGLLH